MRRKPRSNFFKLIGLQIHDLNVQIANPYKRGSDMKLFKKAILILEDTGVTIKAENYGER